MRAIGLKRWNAPLSAGGLIAVSAGASWAAMAILVVASNILVQHLYGKWLTYGAFTYPLTFLVNDLTNRLDRKSVV